MRTTQPGQSVLLLLDAATLLEKRGIDYAVIGGVAASFHGVVRGSVDADAVLSLVVDSIRPLEEAFKKAGFHTQFRRGGHEDPIAAVLVLGDRYGNRVDLLVGLQGLDSAAFGRAVVAPLEGQEIRIMGLEDFIAMKIFAGGPRDLDDAAKAIAVSKDSLDRALLKEVAARFGKESSKRLSKLL